MRKPVSSYVQMNLLTGRIHNSTLEQLSYQIIISTLLSLDVLLIHLNCSKLLIIVHGLSCSLGIIGSCWSSQKINNSLYEGGSDSERLHTS